MRKIEIKSEVHNTEDFDISRLSGKEINSLNDLLKLQIIDLKDVVIEEYANETFVLKKGGEIKGYIKGKESLQDIFDEIKEKYNIEVETKLNLQSHEVAVKQNPKKKIDIGQDFVYANLDRYDMDLLLKMYNNAKDADPKRANLVLNAIFDKLATMGNISKKISFVKNLDNNDIYNRAIFELIKGISNSQEANIIFNEFGKDRLQEVFKQSVLIDDDFAEDYTYYFKAPDDVRGFSVSCGKGYHDEEACESFAAYVFAMTRKYNFQNSQVIANLVSKTFEGNIEQFRDKISSNIQQYEAVRGPLVGIVGKKIFKEKGLIGSVKYILEGTNMTEEQKRRLTEIGLPLAAIGLTIYAIFKIIKEGGWKGFFGLILGELSLEAATGETMFSALSKFLYGGFDGLEEKVKGLGKESRDKKEFANKLGFPMFTLFVMGDYKIEDLKSKGAIKWENGKAKFDVDKFIELLPANDERRKFLKEMIKKHGKNNVNRVFSEAFNKMGLNVHTYNKWHTKKVSDLYQKYLAKLQKAKKTTDTTTNNSTSKSSNSPAHRNSANSSSGSNSSETTDDTSVDDRVETANEEEVILRVGTGESQTPNFRVNPEDDLTTEVIETTEQVRETYIGKVRRNSIFITDSEGREYSQDISLDKKEMLTGIAAQRYSFLKEAVNIWAYNAEKKAENDAFKNTTKQNLKSAAKKIVELLNNSQDIDFTDESKYTQLVNSIFNAVLTVEGESIFGFDDKEDVIDEDDARNLKYILLNLGNKPLSTSEYEDKLIEVYNTMRAGYFNDQGDVDVIKTHVAERLMNTKYKTLLDKLVNIAISKKTRLISANLINTIKTEYNLTEAEKGELLDKLREKQKQYNKWFEKNKDRFGRIYWKSLSNGQIPKDSNGKPKLSEKEFLDNMYNVGFVSSIKFDILDFLVARKDESNRDKFEKLYADIKGFDWFDIADENIALAEEVGFMVLTSMIPGVAGYTAARFLIMASKLNRIKYIGTALDIAGSSLGGYAGAITYESLKDGEWKGSIKGYVEFLMFDVAFRGAGKILSKVNHTGGKITLGGAMTLAGIEAGVNVPRALEGVELEWDPREWTKDEIINSLLILGTILASHKLSGVGKYRISKTSNGEIRIEEISKKTKGEIEKRKSKAETTEQTLMSNLERLEHEIKVRERYLRILESRKAKKIEELEKLTPKVTNLDILKQKINNGEYADIFKKRKRQDIRDIVSDIYRIDLRINNTKAELVKLRKKVDVNNKAIDKLKIKLDKKIDELLFNRNKNTLFSTIESSLVNGKDISIDLGNGIKVEVKGKEIILEENGNHHVFEKIRDFKKEFAKVEKNIDPSKLSEFVIKKQVEYMQKVSNIEYKKSIGDDFKVPEKERILKVGDKKYTVAEKNGEYYIIEKEGKNTYKVQEAQKIDDFLSQKPEVVDAYYQEIYKKYNKILQELDNIQVSSLDPQQQQQVAKKLGIPLSKIKDWTFGDIIKAFGEYKQELGKTSLLKKPFKALYMPVKWLLTGKVKPEYGAVTDPFVTLWETVANGRNWGAVGFMFLPYLAQNGYKAWEGGQGFGEIIAAGLIGGGREFLEEFTKNPGENTIELILWARFMKQMFAYEAIIFGYDYAKHKISGDDEPVISHTN